MNINIDLEDEQVTVFKGATLKTRADVDRFIYALEMAKECIWPTPDESSDEDEEVVVQ